MKIRVCSKRHLIPLYPRIEAPWHTPSAEVVGTVVGRKVPGFLEGRHHARDERALLTGLEILLQLVHVGHPNNHSVSVFTLEKERKE